MHGPLPQALRVDHLFYRARTSNGALLPVHLELLPIDIQPRTLFGVPSRRFCFRKKRRHSKFVPIMLPAIFWMDATLYLVPDVPVERVNINIVFISTSFVYLHIHLH